MRPWNMTVFAVYFERARDADDSITKHLQHYEFSKLFLLVYKMNRCYISVWLLGFHQLLL